jgi:hypothetical protein
VTYFLSAIIVIETAALAAAGYYLWKFSNIILRVEDEMESALDVLDERYRSISKVLEIPLFYDSPEIKRVVDDVKSSREAILRVAGSVAKIEEEKDEG